MSNNSGFFHHFIPKNLPCIFYPPGCPAIGGSDHILNLSASMSKHCPIDKSPVKEEKCELTESLEKDEETRKCIKVSSSNETDNSADGKEGNCTKSNKRVDMNCNDVTKARIDEYDDNCSSNNSVLSNEDLLEEEQTEIEVDDDNCDEGEESGSALPTIQNKEKFKPLAFGIDRILSSSVDNGKDEKLLTSPSHSPVRSNSPPVISNLSLKTGDYSKTPKDDKHHSLLSKLKLCSSDTAKRSNTLPYYHHSFSPSPYQHHHHSILQATPPTGSISSGGTHNHHHPLNHCPECLYLRRYCGGNSGVRANIPSSSSSVNNVATNNMQFSSSMATPCGPVSSPLSASFTWMANPSVYDSSAIISPVAGYNQHVPLQPSFGMGTTSFSTLATMQQCGAGGSSGRRKRSWSRAVFSNLQRKGLEKRFQLQKYITKPDRRQLAATLGLTDAQVKVWFQNRRMKWRHSKEGKVSSGTGEATSVTAVTPSSSSPVTSTTSSKVDGANKDKKA